MLHFAKSCLTIAKHSDQLMPDTAGLSEPERVMLAAAFSLIAQPEPSSIRKLLSCEHGDLFSARHIAHALLIAQYGTEVLKVTD